MFRCSMFLCAALIVVGTVGCKLNTPDTDSEPDKPGGGAGGGDRSVKALTPPSFTVILAGRRNHPDAYIRISDVPTIMSLNDIDQEVRLNAFAAEKKYKGKTFRVVGHACGTMDTSSNGMPEVWLTDFDWTNTPFERVLLVFGTTTGVDKIKCGRKMDGYGGDWVVVDGIYDGTTTYRNCRLVGRFPTKEEATKDILPGR